MSSCISSLILVHLILPLSYNYLHCLEHKRQFAICKCDYRNNVPEAEQKIMNLRKSHAINLLQLRYHLLHISEARDSAERVFIEARGNSSDVKLGVVPNKYGVERWYSRRMNIRWLITNMSRLQNNQMLRLYYGVW